MLGKESADIDETHKLKHGDDYRGKIIHDKDRFQDKIHEKESKRNSEKETLKGSSKRKAKQPKNVINAKKIDTPTEKSQNSFVLDHQSGDVTSFENDAKAAKVIVSAPESIRKEKEISFEEQKTELLKKRKMAEKVRKDLNLKETSQQNEEVYDPLGKDLDNDGIIDRYDNDFRDSDYFESAYDVEDNLQTKEDRTESCSKNHKAQKKLYKRKNYSDKVYTRKKEDTPADDKAGGKKSAKEVIQDREKKNRISKEQETSKKKNAVKVSALCNSISTMQSNS